MHRLESGAFGYELLWNPHDPGYTANGRFLAGLTDPATLLDRTGGRDGRPPTTADRSAPSAADLRLQQPNRSGSRAAVVGPWSGPGRGVVGPRSDPIRGPTDAALTCCDGRGVALMGKRGVHVPQRIPGDPSDAHGFPALVEEFLTDLGARGYSPATIRARRQCLAALSAWLARPRGHPAGGGDPADAGPLSASPVPLPQGRRRTPVASGRQNARLLPVRAFFKWAVRNDHVGSNPASDLELPKVENRLPKAALTIEEAEPSSPSRTCPRPPGCGTGRCIETFYGTGIRRSELARLNLRDLDIERRTLMVRQGKGRKDRMVPIGPRAIAWIERYLSESGPRFAGEPRRRDAVPHRRRHRVLVGPAHPAGP